MLFVALQSRVTAPKKLQTSAPVGKLSVIDETEGKAEWLFQVSVPDAQGKVEVRPNVRPMANLGLSEEDIRQLSCTQAPRLPRL